MLTKNEIISNFVSNLKLASTDAEEAEYLSKYNPKKYIDKGYINKPEFSDISNNMLDSIIKGNPGLFFDLKLDESPEYIKYEKRAAQLLAITNPLLALVYKIQEKPYFQSSSKEAKVLQESLLFRLNYALGGDAKRLSLKILEHPNLKEALFEILVAIQLHNKELYNSLPEDFYKIIEQQGS